MKEIELKVLEIDVKALEKKLIVLGAKKILPLTLIREMLFDTPDHKISKQENLFRLRQEGKKTYITYKHGHKFKGHFRTNQEIELDVGSFTETDKLLTQLGFVHLQEREKQRFSYRLGKIRIEIDKYPNLPAYAEFEGPAAQTKALLKKLDIDIKNTNTLTVGGVMKYYGVYRKIVKF